MANEKQKARLAAAEAAMTQLTALGEDAWSNQHYPNPVANNAAQRLREQKEEQAQRAKLAKEVAQRRQYAETHAAFIAGIVGTDPAVAAAEAAVTSAQRAVDELTREHEATVAQLQALNQNAVVDLSQVSMKELLRTAATREKSRTVEAAALLAVRDELGRRQAEAAATLAEAQHTLLRQQRLSLHRHCDLLLEQLHPLLVGANDLFAELYKTQDSIREMGGPRQPLASRAWQARLTWLVERWDTEMAEIKKFSEAYQ